MRKHVTSAITIHGSATWWEKGIGTLKQYMSVSASAIAFPRIKNSLNLTSNEAMTCGEVQILG
jgi:hypothetical protein